MFALLALLLAAEPEPAPLRQELAVLDRCELATAILARAPEAAVRTSEGRAIVVAEIGLPGESTRSALVQGTCTPPRYVVVAPGAEPAGPGPVLHLVLGPGAARDVLLWGVYAGPPGPAPRKLPALLARGTVRLEPGFPVDADP